MDILDQQGNRDRVDRTDNFAFVVGIGISFRPLIRFASSRVHRYEAASLSAMFAT
jgi:hypothetical protein